MSPASALPEAMTAIEISAPGGPEVLRPAKRPVPKPGAGEILIRVEAAGVNRPDVFQRKGLYPPPPGASDLPGLEVAGEVVATGDDIASPGIGERVCALAPGGGYAQYCVVPAGHALPIPAGFDAVMAAALPETFFTVWINVFERARLQAGERFLVHGGSSGIGTTAIQLAALRGARVFATAGSAEKCRTCESLGAERAINYREEDFVAVIKDATGDGVDVILDMVGGDYIARNVKALRPDGRLSMIAFLGGSKVQMDFNPVMLKRLTITGSTLRPRSVQTKAAIAERLQKEVWPHLEAGRIRPIIDSRFPLERAGEAHALMESSTHIGKIMLTC